ncbi:MAG: O-antigen ligase family protein [Candidatus Paceibacterota bacterium]|jgi:O-antigen ligase/Flp pilus assembly protein TadD
MQIAAKQTEGTAKQIAKLIALGALFLIPFAPLIVADAYFFPFITGKAFYFRILVEIAVAAWVVLALLDREYRPRLSWVGAAVLAFVVWMFVADLFAINAAKAFWSNFERMEGWVLLAHLLGFFFVASAVLRVEMKWRAWFLTSLGVSCIVALYAFLQLAGTLAIHQGSTRIDASFGNSIYLAVYFLFNVFIAGWLALTERRVWLKWSLLALASVEGILIFFTQTRGTTWGLIAALALAALLTALTAGKRARRYAAGAFVLIVLLAGSLYLARGSSFVQGNSVLQRISSITLADLEVRFTIWHIAFQGALARPFTGWGQEGFNYAFSTYYNPSLHEQEPWFDRAHNAFIDWLSAGGIPAFLLYLSIFGSALVLLWRPASPELQRGKHSELSRPERIALTAALVGYALHNLLVFDNLYSYIYFFVLLALIDSQIARPIEKLERLPTLDAEQGMTYALPVAAVVSIALIWSVNVSGMRVAAKLITALSSASVDREKSLAVFEDLAAHPAFAAQEVREQLVAFAAAVAQNPSATQSEKQRAVSLAVLEMQKQVAAYPRDVRERLQLAYVYRIAGEGELALREIQVAAALSPKKEQIWIEAGAAEWDRGDFKAAQSAFNTAYALGPQFPELAAYAAAGAFVTGDRPAAEKILLDAYGTTTVDSNVLAVVYYQMKDWPRLIALWQLRAAKPNAGVEAWFSLAAAYYTAGDSANAAKTIRAAMARFPEAAANGAAALQQIEKGQ